MKKPELQNYNGRKQINHPSRTRSFSRRASKGTLIVEKKTCLHCGHDKALTNMSSNSSNFNRSKCAKCKKWL